MRLSLMFVLFLLPSGLQAQDSAEKAVSGVVSFEKDIAPIFSKHCTACHSGRELKSRFDISSYEGMVKGGKRGTASCQARPKAVSFTR